jgi:hypothetical protein
VRQRHTWRTARPPRVGSQTRQDHSAPTLPPVAVVANFPAEHNAPLLHSPSSCPGLSDRLGELRLAVLPVRDVLVPRLCDTATPWAGSQRSPRTQCGCGSLWARGGGWVVSKRRNKWSQGGTGRVTKPPAPRPRGNTRAAHHAIQSWEALVRPSSIALNRRPSTSELQRTNDLGAQQASLGAPLRSASCCDSSTMPSKEDMGVLASNAARAGHTALATSAAVWPELRL